MSGSRNAVDFIIFCVRVSTFIGPNLETVLGCSLIAVDFACENQVNWTVDAILDPTNHTWESAAICRLLPPKFPDTRMNELRISIRPEVN